MLGVGGRETGKDPIDIIADLNFGPIQRIFLKNKLKWKKWPKDFEEFFKNKKIAGLLW